MQPQTAQASESPGNHRSIILSRTFLYIFPFFAMRRLPTPFLDSMEEMDADPYKEAISLGLGFEIEKSPHSGAFPLFSELPFDIRLIIWELTWPEPRAIEVANTKYDEHEAEYTGTTFLRLTAPLLALLKTDFGKDSTPDGDPLTECPAPVALHVCRESRKHTLMQYRVMQHPDSPMYSFFYSPFRDVFFISRALSTQPQCVQALEHLYRDQLDTITTLLVEDGEWTWSSPADYTEKWLGPLHGLEIILVTYGGYDAVWVDYLRNDTSPEIHLSIANSLRKGFKEFLETGRTRARKLEYIDRNGRFY